MRGSDVDVILIGSFIAVIIEFAYIIGFKNMGFISIKSSIAIMDGFVYSRNLVLVFELGDLLIRQHTLLMLGGIAPSMIHEE